MHLASMKNNEQSIKQNQCSKHQKHLKALTLIKTFILFSPSHPVILRGAEGEVAESIIQNNHPPSGEEGPWKTVGEGQTRTLTPHPP